MMENSGQKFGLPTLDELFSTQENRDERLTDKVVNLPIAEISGFPNHPFQVNVDEEMLELAESIRQYGVLSPAIVRPKSDGGYEMIAGHRRMKGSQLTEKEHIPCIIRNLSDDEATILMVDSNLQRESLLPSEKAFAYKMKLDAMKRQGQRTDLTSRPVVGKLESSEIIGVETGGSGRQIQRFIRLTELIYPLLQMVDEKKIAFRPAVELSYLPHAQQQLMLKTMEELQSTPSLSQAQRMKKCSQEGRLTGDVMYVVLSEEKPNQVEKIKVPVNRIKKLIPKGYTERQTEDLIVRLLENWCKNRQPGSR